MERLDQLCFLRRFLVGIVIKINHRMADVNSPGRIAFHPRLDIRWTGNGIADHTGSPANGAGFLKSDPDA